MFWKKTSFHSLPQKDCGMALTQSSCSIPSTCNKNLATAAAETPKNVTKPHRTSAHLVTHIEVASNTSNREHHQLERCRNSCLGKKKNHQGPLTKSSTKTKKRKKKLSFLTYALGICMGSRISAMISWKKNK